MDTQNKCCGNCKHFKDEDVNGEGFCEVKYEFEGCCHECDNHEFRNNGWNWTVFSKSEIIAWCKLSDIEPYKDEVDCIPKDKVVVGWFYNKEFRSCSLPFFGLRLNL